MARFSPLPVPPLRERRDGHTDPGAPLRGQVRQANERRIENHSLLPQAMEAFASYPWPGNVRELQNYIERAVIRRLEVTFIHPLAELKQATIQGRTFQAEHSRGRGRNANICFGLLSGGIQLDHWRAQRCGRCGWGMKTNDLGHIGYRKLKNPVSSGVDACPQHNDFVPSQ